MIWFEHHYGDVFETPETDERARYYDVTYHPHARFDGARYIGGAQSCASITESYRQAIQDRLDETGGSPVSITGAYALSPESASVNATFRLVDEWELYEPRATIVVYEDSVYWCCGAYGQDNWDRVTRIISDHPVTLENPGDEAVVSVEIPLDPSWDQSELHFVAFLQDVPTLEIIQGKVLSHSTPGAADQPPSKAPMLEVVPNPFHTDVSIRLSIAGDGTAPARLVVVDSHGRAVIEPVSLQPGTHEWRWGGRDAAGDRLASGVYFVRLEQGAAVRTSRLVLTR